MKILDCTLRDGGYYTNWDFENPLVEIYMRSFNDLPVDYLEIGYRSKPMKEYLGKFFYCPLHVLQRIKTISQKKIVVMLNEKDTQPADIKSLLGPCAGLVDMVRVAVDPQNLGRALVLAEAIKKENPVEVGFNVMYMSKWSQFKAFMSELKSVADVADYFYLVDSYGGVYPDDVRRAIDQVRQHTTCALGFHGHNNLELGLINTLTAIESGVEIVDSTVTGMGRGAGNLKTELLLTSLNEKKDLPVNFDSLSKVVDGFQQLQRHHEWGTNLPYMVSGANSLPQKDVMEWVTKRFYSFNSIIRALQNQKAGVTDNEQLPVFKPAHKVNKAMIIGGGPHAASHAEAIKQYIASQKDICMIHASSKNAATYKDVKCPQYFCLVGNEGHRLEKVFSDFGDFDGYCVLPPFPRKMGTYIPQALRSIAFELSKIGFTDRLHDSHTVLALQTALTLGAAEVLLAGYDGYQGETITQLEKSLADENDYTFNQFQHNTTARLSAITPTAYKTLPVQSVYAILL